MLAFLGFCPLQEACGRTMVFMSFFLIVHDEEHLFIFSFPYYSSPGLSREGVSCGPVWLGNHFVAQVGFKHIIFLPLVPKCCDYRIVPSCLTYGMVLLKNYFKFFACVFLCECMCVVYVCECRCPWRPAVSDPLGTRVASGCEPADKVLGIVLRSSARAVSTVNCWIICPAQPLSFCFLFFC